MVKQRHSIISRRLTRRSVQNFNAVSFTFYFRITQLKASLGIRSDNAMWLLMNRRETALKIQATMCAARVNANGWRNGGGRCHFYIIHTQTNAVILIHAHFSTDVFVPKMFATNACAWWIDLVLFSTFPTIRYFTPLFWQTRSSIFYSTTLSGLDGFKLIFW